MEKDYWVNIFLKNWWKTIEDRNKNSDNDYDDDDNFTDNIFYNSNHKHSLIKYYGTIFLSKESRK